ASIYGEHGIAYEDNAARFIFFSKAALELARRMTPTPQILHAHDWAAAFVPVLVADQKLPFATVLTIHHLAEQGSFWGLDFDLTMDGEDRRERQDRKSTRLNSSHVKISYAVFCLKKKNRR